MVACDTSSRAAASSTLTRPVSVSNSRSAFQRAYLSTTPPLRESCEVLRTLVRETGRHKRVRCAVARGTSDLGHWDWLPVADRPVAVASCTMTLGTDDFRTDTRRAGGANGTRRRRDLQPAGLLATGDRAGQDRGDGTAPTGAPGGRRRLRYL